MENERINSPIEQLGITHNGYRILFDGKNSHAITHFQKNPKLRTVLSEVIPELTITKNIERHEIELDEIIGESDLVETTDTDEIIYALRPLRQQYSRFVKNKQPQPTRNIVIDLRKQKDDTYLLTLYCFYWKNYSIFPWR